jgi:hypothetical protein
MGGSPQEHPSEHVCSTWMLASRSRRLQGHVHNISMLSTHCSEMKGIGTRTFLQQPKSNSHVLRPTRITATGTSPIILTSKETRDSKATVKSQPPRMCTPTSTQATHMHTGWIARVVRAYTAVSERVAGKAMLPGLVASVDAADTNML